MNDVPNLIFDKKLKEFIEKEFHVMRRDEREEKELRDKKRPGLKIIRYREAKRIKRKYNRQLAKLKAAKSAGSISG